MSFSEHDGLLRKLLCLTGEQDTQHDVAFKARRLDLPDSVSENEVPILSLHKTNGFMGTS
jgi:hypothetical protein